MQRFARHKTPMMMEEYSHSRTILDIEEARKKLGKAVQPTRKAAGR